MSIEVALFVIVGGISVVAAAMMLLTENAVHSALFLILNFICVAFLYLMLDAPFLAMVQIAVYAGAIMVLFLFVIMLLGAEKVGQSAREFKWLAPVTLALALSFVFATFFAFSAGDIDSNDPVASGDPLLRVVHAASGFPEAVDVYANGELLIGGLELGDGSAYVAVPAGTYAVSVAVAGDDPALALPLGDITLQPDSAQTAIAYGAGRLPSIALVNEDLSDTPDRSGRLIVFNAYTGVPSINIVDPGNDFIIEADEAVTVFYEGLAQGTASMPELYRQRTVNWAFVPSDNPDNVLYRLRDYVITPGETQLLVLSEEPGGVGDGLRPMSISLVSQTLASFGSPSAIGASLFVKYVLPFEIVAVLLLAAMVGAIVLTQRGDVKPKPGRPTRRKVSRPLTSVIASQTGHDVHDLVELPRLKEPEPAEPVGD